MEKSLSDLINLPSFDLQYKKPICLLPIHFIRTNGGQSESGEVSVHEHVSKLNKKPLIH